MLSLSTFTHSWTQPLSLIRSYFVAGYSKALVTLWFSWISGGVRGAAAAPRISALPRSKQREEKSNSRLKASCSIHRQKRGAAEKSFHKPSRCYLHYTQILGSGSEKSYLRQFCLHLMLVMSKTSLFVGNVIKSEHAQLLLLFVRDFRISTVWSIINSLLLNVTDRAMGFTDSSFIN